MIDERLWRSRADLAQVYLDWGGHAWARRVEGDAERDLFAGRLAGIDAVVQNQDNREHDLLDSDDYYRVRGRHRRRCSSISPVVPAILS